jgi:benzoyl-CoA-dihydrodiol lyase
MAESNAPQMPVSFETRPYEWTHWKLDLDADAGIATVSMDVQEDKPFRPGYELKLNSYDIGVDIELQDIAQRLRFEHPAVRAVVVTSARDRVFCAGANIRMLASSTHPFKVNFCKYTNETRCGLEDASAHSGTTFIAALNGPCAGGGYELALACDEIYLVDDGSSAVSLPEVPLLGVLPGTGGLTRLVDKRKVRRDIADVFCTKAEGFKARDAVKHRLVDGAFRRSRWDESVRAAAEAAVARAGGPGSEQGIKWTPVTWEETEAGRRYRYVELALDSEGRTATLTLHGPGGAAPDSHEALHALGADSWALRAFRELEHALLELRFNHLDLGLLLLHTRGDAAAVLAWDAAIATLRADGSWLAREIQLFQARTLQRLDNMSRSMFAILDMGHCFAGSLFELALSADRSYMFLDEDAGNSLTVGPASAGALPMYTGATRLEVRFYGEPERVGEILERAGEAIDAEEAEELGLVTASPDDIDWADEIRVAIEERVSLSPDGLTGMEQNLRFVGGETCTSRIYGRLSAWQNWIFQRPNAVGPSGALTLYGHPERAQFDLRRV